MKERDPWYVRLPDGRTFKVKSSAAVRHHIEAGTIPLNSYVRRDAEHEWVSLAMTPEFANQNVGGTNRSPASLADLSLPPLPNRGANEEPPKSGVSSRLDPLKLQTVGIRGYIDELFAAFDSTMQPSKLVVGCLTGAAVFVVLALLARLLPEIGLNPSSRIALLILWAALLAIVAVGTTFIGRQTHLELTKMSPASPSETMSGFVPPLIQVLICFGIIGGVACGAYILLDILREQLATPAIVGSLVVAIGFPVMVVAFVLLILLPLLPPILVVEGGSFMEGLREWRALLREHRMRVLLYEGFAIVMGAVAMVPLLIPYTLAEMFFPTGPTLLAATSGNLIHGIAIGPFLAFLAVANVFIYLNLRYEYTPHK